MKAAKDYPPGTVINEKFEIKERIAMSSTGADVYSGTHLGLQRDILIKILPPASSYDNTLVQRFLQEIKITASLQHPNILPAFEAGEIDERYYLVTAYEKGFYLNDYIEQRGFLEEKEGLKILQDLCKAMKYAWEKEKILHRNIKPGSIWLARGNVPMLTDFGMAKATDNMQHLTLTGTTIGNPMYMSPEQARGKKDLDFRADMYCLGLVLFFILTEQDPFAEKNPLALLEAQISKKPASISDYNESVSKGCISLFKKMTAKDREKRYSSWDEVINEITNLLEGKKIRKVMTTNSKQRKSRDSNTPEPVGIPEKQKSPVKWIVLATIVILIILGIIFAAI